MNLLPEELITIKVILKLRLWKQRSFAAANKLNHYVIFDFNCTKLYRNSASVPPIVSVETFHVLLLIEVEHDS